MAKTPRIVKVQFAFPGPGERGWQGELGPEKFVTVHYTAGPVDLSDAHAIQLCRSYHEAHKQKFNGAGIGYHLCITRAGTLLLLRPTRLKGVHVGGANSNNLGVMFHGTTGDRPSPAQVRTFRWLIRKGHSKAMPASHRTDRRLYRPYTKRLGHNDWPRHASNGCPGNFKSVLRFRTR